MSQYAAAHGRSMHHRLCSALDNWLRELKHQQAAAGFQHAYIERSALSLSVTLRRPNEMGCNQRCYPGTAAPQRSPEHTNVANHTDITQLLAPHFEHGLLISARTTLPVSPTRRENFAAGRRCHQPDPARSAHGVRRCINRESLPQTMNTE